ncbi:MAG: TetR family transcriptional regulator C-terminal domain-containing protein [Clostridia bacterium]|nr:TetR family transcriptional regulator C-terminal domain-containing protein [Clostridia bacterium]
MKESRRVTMTKMLLKESLLELMAKKPISKITIKEICDSADLNRTTFYSHYADQFALLEEIENDAIEKTDAFLAQIGDNENRLSIFEEFFTYIKSDVKVFSVLLRTDIDNTFKLRFVEVCIAHLSKYDYHENLSDNDKDYIYRFIFMGALSVLEKWIENDFDKSPRQMSELILALIPSITAVKRKQLHVADI